MARDVLDPRIFRRITSSPKIGKMDEQSVRNAISKIHIDNHGLTMNAAAAEFAKNKGIKVNRYLNADDRFSFQYLKQPRLAKIIPIQGGKKTIKVAEIKPDFASEFISEAHNNAKIYQHIFILENTLRRVIFEQFGEGLEWWNDSKIVKKDTQDYAARIKEAEKKYPWMKERGNHPIWYVGLLELFQIIDKNWKLHFEPIFKDLDQLRAMIKESVPIRNYVAHNVKTRELERQLIEKNTDYICRLVENWRKTKPLP